VKAVRSMSDGQSGGWETCSPIANLTPGYSHDIAKSCAVGHEIILCFVCSEMTWLVAQLVVKTEVWFYIINVKPLIVYYTIHLD